MKFLGIDLGWASGAIGDREVGRWREPEKQTRSLPITPSPYHPNSANSDSFCASGYIVVPQPLIQNESLRLNRD